MVEAMAGFVMPDDEICRLVIDPRNGKTISETTLKNHFREQLANGRAKIRMRHHMALFKNVETGNVTAQIWWDKTRNHINERFRLDFPAPTSPDQVPQDKLEGHSMLDIARRIAFTLAMGAEAQKKPEPPPTPQKQRQPA